MYIPYDTQISRTGGAAAVGGGDRNLFFGYGLMEAPSVLLYVYGDQSDICPYGVAKLDTLRIVRYSCRYCFINTE